MKAWFIKHRRKFLVAVISCAAVLGVLLAAAAGLYFYWNSQYSDSIVWKDIDVSLPDLAFTDADMDDSYEDAERITLSDGQFFTDSAAVQIDGNCLVIRAAGTYILSGEMADGMILVDTQEKLRLVLENCSVHNPNGPALYIRAADKVFLTLADGTVNQLSDGSSYTYTDGESAVDAALFSRADLTVNGSGSLTVKGNYKHGILSKDDLVITGGSYDITSVKKALHGKDCIKIYDCDMRLQAGTDGLCSDNAEEAHRGFIYLQGGTLDIVCGNDGIQAANTLILENPTVNIVSGGGSANAPVREKRHPRDEDDEEAEDTESTKGLKSARDIWIKGGVFVIDSKDDTVHADGSVRIEGGEFTLRSGDDAVHAESALYTLGGRLDIQTCYEGLEACEIAIAGGDISVVSSDDGVNASAGETASPITMLKRLFVWSLNGKLEITGGKLCINSAGDGLDSNGIMTVAGGTTFVAGPSDHGNGVLDCDGSRIVTGGTVLCLGGDEDERFTEVTGQVQVIKVLAPQSAGTPVTLCDESGNVLVCFTAPKEFSCILATAPEMQRDGSYIIKVSDQILP